MRHNLPQDNHSKARTWTQLSDFSLSELDSIPSPSDPAGHRGGFDAFCGPALFLRQRHEQAWPGTDVEERAGSPSLHELAQQRTKLRAAFPFVGQVSSFVVTFVVQPRRQLPFRERPQKFQATRTAAKDAERLRPIPNRERQNFSGLAPTAEVTPCWTNAIWEIHFVVEITR
jgi:hypothetical protein